MNLELQLATLARFGLPLAEGVHIDDLLYSFERSEYEEKALDLVLFALGMEIEREPWGRQVCPRAWNFDTECIHAPGDYAAIVHKLADLSCRSDHVSNVEDCIDFENGLAWIAYTLDGVPRKWAVELNEDWADTLALGYVMSDFEGNDGNFYCKDNGQSMVLFWMEPSEAARLNELCSGALQRVTAGGP